MAANSKMSASVPPFDEVFDTADYFRVCPKQINDAFAFFEADPNVQTCFLLRMDALFNGGVDFKREGKVLDDTAKTELSRIWVEFLREIVRNAWAAGFAACVWIKDSTLVGRPVVLTSQR